MINLLMLIVLLVNEQLSPLFLVSNYYYYIVVDRHVNGDIIEILQLKFNLFFTRIKIKTKIFK